MLDSTIGNTARLPLAAGPMRWLKVTTTPKNYFPLAKTYLVRFQHGFWNVLGKPLTTS